MRQAGWVCCNVFGVSHRHLKCTEARVFWRAKRAGCCGETDSEVWALVWSRCVESQTVAQSD